MAKKYQDEGWLRTEYVEKGRSTYQMAEDVPVTQETVRNWLEKHEIERREREIELPDQVDVDKSKIEDLYHNGGLTTRDIAEILGCSREVIRMCLHESGSPPRKKYEHKLYEPVYHRTTANGYEKWQIGIGGDKHDVPVHRLVAVAEYGYDEVVDKVVHHKNHIPWDNRHENLELMSASEHSRYHINVRHGNVERDLNV